MSRGATTGMNANYNANSLPQLTAVLASEAYIRCAIDALNLSSSSLVMIADFGSSHGFNALQAIKIIIKCIREMKNLDEHNQFLVFFNDVPTNDWTSLFQLIATESTFYGTASGRSFYERCFPSNSLSVAYSSFAVHWLSCKPCNLSNHCHSALVEHGPE